MNILNAVRGQPLARKTLALSLLAALCTLHARTALPDTQPGTAPASVSEAAPDLTPLTSATSVPAPSDDGAGTLGASALQPGVSSILARLSPAIIYVPPVVTDPVDLAILDARKAMQTNNLAAFDTAAALVPRGHALSSYLDYWRLRIRLAASAPTDAEYLAVSADARSYLKQFPRTLTADLLRRDWMLAAGRRQDWATIDALYPAWTLKDESAPECLASLSTLSRVEEGRHPGAATLRHATSLLLQPQALNSSCTTLLQTLAEHEWLTPAQRQQRLNLALEINNPAEIRQAVALLPQPPEAKALDLALNKPAQLLNATALLVPTAKAPLRSAAITQPGIRTASHRSQTSAHLIPADGRQHATVLTVAQRESDPRSSATRKNTNAAKAAGRTKASLATPNSKGIASRTHKAATGKATHKTTQAAAQKSGAHRKAGAAAATAAAASKAAARTPLTPVLARIALVRLARQDPARAAALMDAGKTPDGRTLKLGTADRAFVWSQIAAAGMFRLDPQAPAWAEHARNATISDHTRVWLARAALAEQDWTGLERILRAMDPALRQSPTWTYWHGRAQDALGHHKQARHIFQGLATRHDYYGKLAREELALPPAALPTPKAAPDSLVKAMDDNDGIRQAMAFYALGLRGEGNREWNFQMRGRNEQELRAAATWAARHGLLDRAINTDERILTGQADYSLRFPTPFAEQLLTITSQHAIDPAWVYGLIRQESRFVMQARSHVGASGLMQIMPDTARWVARQMGNTTYQAGQIDDLTTNLTFGSYYLKRALDDLSGSPVLATAGYNAGPRRAHTWRASLSRPLEGAIFTELIPFTETRHYVKAVLSNTVDYATLFSGQPQSLKSWLATITPQPVGVAQLP